MGCCTSNFTEATPKEASGLAAKRYFKLSGLPVSLSTKSHGQTGLALAVVGLNCHETLLKLEAAFEYRGFKIQHATLIRQGDLIDYRFQLEYLGRRFDSDSTKESPETVSVPVNLELKSVPATLAEVQTAESSCKLATGGAEELLNVRTHGKYRLGMRAGVIDVLRGKKLEVIAATFMTTGPAESMIVNDMFWIPSHRKTYGLNEVNRLQAAIQAGLIKTLSSREAQARAKQENSGEHTPVKVYNPTSIDHSPIKMYQSSSKLVTAMSEADGRDLALHVKGLPNALRSGLKGVHYPVKGPTESGVQIDGFAKYMGAGLTKRPYGAEHDRDTPILELRTLFIRDNASYPSEKNVWFKQLMGIEKEYAEFVSLLDIQSKTFVIFKAFLNDVLTPGNGYGALAIAEHLLGAPSTVFSASTASPRKLTQYDWPTWLPSVIDSVPDLDSIYVCDVVNWNTYALMSMAAMSDRSKAVSSFGENFAWAVNDELKRSRLTEESLIEASQLDIFASTNLGKLVMKILEHLDAHRGINLQATGVEVIFSKTHLELVNGEFQRQMDIRVFIKANPSSETGCTATQNSDALLHVGDSMRNMASGKGVTSIPCIQSSTAVLLDTGFDVPIPITDSIKSCFSPSAICNPAPDTSQMTISPAKEIMGLTQLQRQISEINFQSEGSLDGQQKNDDKQASLSSTLCISGMVSAMSSLVHELQYERGLSCFAVAESVTIAACGGDANSKLARLQQQLDRTNLCLNRTVSMIEKLWTPNAGDDFQDLFQEGVICFQNVSVKVLMQRQLVNAASEAAPSEWVRRYLLCSGGETGYDNLVTILLDWIISALRTLPLDGADMAPLRQEFIWLAVFKEQLGRERGYLASKACSRWTGQAADDETLTVIVEGRLRLLELLGLSKNGESSSNNSWEEVPPILTQLGEIEATLRREALDPEFLLKDNDVAVWFAQMTECMNTINLMLKRVLQQLKFQPENFSRCLPTSFNCELESEVEVLEVLDMELTMDLARKLRDRHFTRIVALVGAGISVSANIPDFRSAGGLYDQLKARGFKCPECVFTSSFVEESPGSFYSLMNQLRTENALPTTTHHFLKLLHKKKMLLRCYTQNIDGLERKAGIPAERLVEAHGTMHAAKCLKCGLRHPADAMWSAEPAAKSYPKCRACHSLLRPDIVFFGEDLPKRFQDLAVPDLRSADLVVIMGTSLCVQPFASLIDKAKLGCPRLIVNLNVPAALRARPWSNLTKDSKLLSKIRPSAKTTDAFLLGKCDEAITWFAMQLGWEEELSARRMRMIEEV